MSSGAPLPATPASELVPDGALRIASRRITDGASAVVREPWSGAELGRIVLAESHDIPNIVQAVTSYVARRLVERQRALDEDPEFITRVTRGEAGRALRRRRWRIFGTLVIGFLLGIVTLIAVALFFASKS